MLSEYQCETNLVAIGEVIANRRHELGLNMKTVAADVGISKTVLSQIENGRYKSLKVAVVAALCEYLQITDLHLLKV